MKHLNTRQIISRSIFILIFAISLCPTLFISCNQSGKKTTVKSETQSEEQIGTETPLTKETQTYDKEDVSVDDQSIKKPEEENPELGNISSESDINKQTDKKSTDKTNNQDIPPNDTEIKNETKEPDEKQTETKTEKTEKEEVVEKHKDKEVEKKTEKEKTTKEDNWTVPSKYKSMQNTYKADSESLSIGKSLYSKYCKSCHGSKGLGDGAKATYIDTEIRSFKSSAFKAQKPGVIYYKSYVGRAAMPNFEKKITDDEDRWAIINYLMTF